MKFTTPCFVRVENAEKREELMGWCREIGYVQKYDNLDYALLVIAGFENGQVDSAAAIDDVIDALFGFVDADCGADVGLFKALAAMNDENDREQWFVNDLGLWYKASGDESIAFTYDEHHDKHFFRKATAEEIIEHFTNKKRYDEHGKIIAHIWRSRTTSGEYAKHEVGVCNLGDYRVAMHRATILTNSPCAFGKQYTVLRKFRDHYLIRAEETYNIETWGHIRDAIDNILFYQ